MIFKQFSDTVGDSINLLFSFDQMMLYLGAAFHTSLLFALCRQGARIGEEMTTLKCMSHTCLSLYRRFLLMVFFATTIMQMQTKTKTK